MIITAMTPGSIVSVKLMSGEEVVGSFVKQDDKGVTLRKPLLAAMTQQGPTLAPFMYTVDVMETSQELTLNQTGVVAVTATFKPFADAYTQATSGIAPASAMPGLVK